jgi:hypothetical protein
MSAAHLHVVPDPDDAPTTAPAAVGVPPGEGAVVVELEIVPAQPEPAGEREEDQADEDLAEEAGDELEELDDEEPGEEDQEEVRPRRALTLPNLRPYVVPDRGTVQEFTDLAADVRRTNAPRLRPVWQILRTGTVALLLVARAWFSGEIAPKVKPLWRLILGPLIAVYAVGQTVVLYPWAPAFLVPAWPLLALLAQRWATVQVKGAGKGATGPGKDGVKEAAKASGKRAPNTLAGRLAAVIARPSAEASPEEPAVAPAEGSEEPDEEAVEELEETPLQEAPAAPSRDEIVRALHSLVGGSSGVLDTALRDHLRYPSTRAVREALSEAGIPHRDGVRAVGGNGPGVHRRDFPPLPPLQEGAPGPGVVAGQDANNNANNAGEGSREGLGADGNQESPYPFDVVPDPERGPAAWKIIPRK